MGRDHQALELLKRLQEMVPNESTIYVNMGLIYKKMNLKKEALDAFNKARDLDQKDLNGVANLIKSLEQPSGGDMDDGDDVF